MLQGKRLAKAPALAVARVIQEEVPEVTEDTAWEAVAVETVKPWMRRYAEWLAGEVGRPPLDSRIRRASQLAGLAIGRVGLKALEKRQDWVAYYQKLLADETQMSQAIVKAKMVGVIEQGFAMAEVAARELDYAEYRKYWNAMLDRAYPVTQREAPSVGQVVIHMHPQSFAARLVDDRTEIVVLDPE